MKRVFKVIALLLVTVVVLFYLFNFDAVNYGWRQAKGQLKIIFNTEPVTEILSNPDFPDSLRYKIDLIEEIKAFTVDSLGLRPSNSYEDYYDQKGEPVLWVITACEPYSLEARKWKFPIVGEFAYKGHFEKERALSEADELKTEGLDVRIGEVSAWSTLGYLNDPILSMMLDKSEGQLAALIIHELTHGTLFVKNDLEFNENLADFVGDHGARRFLRARFGEDSEEVKKYEYQLEFQLRFSDYMKKSTEELDSLYQTFRPEMASNIKDTLKYEMIYAIMHGAESLDSTGHFKYRGRGTINNAYFTAFKTYQARQTVFEDELRNKFNGNFTAYLAYLREEYSTLGK